ncbi:MULTISPECIES: GTPase domain-containing protein [Enterobacteriaceae]|uniref:GTPase domain-containing protein n=1 Tax=Enterobacteriaceae TaxID=543 RepID=UPI00201694DE|nr:GTPase domain-containing protein [Klebsiella pneumoniae]MDW1202166.1 GTPase domain-containing protein [Klebsiella pneumoniae]
MFKYKPKNLMVSIGVWTYAIVITLLAFIYSYQKNDVQELIKEHSLILNIIIFSSAILILVQSQFIYVNKRFKDRDYNRIYSYNDLSHYKDIIPVVAVLGLSRTGKTTLIDTVFYNKPLNKRTQGIYGRLKNIGNKKDVFFYDMSGENIIQINNVMHLSDCIIFLLDHNESSDDTAINQQRINANIKLIEDLSSSYNEKGNNKTIPTLFLINKSDLSRDYDLYEKFYKKAIINWSHVFGKSIKCMVYSNKNVSEAIDNNSSTTYALKDVIEFIEVNVYEK